MNSYGTILGRVVNAQVNHGDQDGLVTTPPTAGDDGTNGRHRVDLESVESMDGKRIWPMPRVPAMPSARWVFGTAPVVEPGGNPARM